MIQVTRKELWPGVYLTAVHTNKFKTSLLGVRLLTPLRHETAALNALVPYVLRRGTAQHPDLESLGAVLDDLYGGTVEPVVRKKGETQCVGFVASFLDDAYALEGEQLLEPAAALLGQLLLCPAPENGGFRADYVKGERSNLVDRIRAQINEKRQYAGLRLMQEMCAAEPYGTDRLGDEKLAAAITGEGLWAAYQTLLSTAQVELYYCGSATAQRAEEALSGALRGLTSDGVRTAPSCVVSPPAPDTPKVIKEVLDVTQGKLSLGFRIGGATVQREDFPALMVFNAVYGGTTTSKLFMNVRERCSLCYFASSMLERLKGILLVSSGVEFEKYGEARDEILAQLDACRRGDITEQELEAARRSVAGSLRTAMDSQGLLEDFWLGQAIAALTEGPEELAQRVEQVSKEAVVAAAKGVALDTIYFLTGREDS